MSKMPAEAAQTPGTEQADLQQRSPCIVESSLKETHDHGKVKAKSSSSSSTISPPTPTLNGDFSGDIQDDVEKSHCCRQNGDNFGGMVGPVESTDPPQTMHNRQGSASCGFQPRVSSSRVPDSSHARNCMYRTSRLVHGQRPLMYQNGTDSGDDMENYFNSNAHMLAYLELNDSSASPENNDTVSLTTVNSSDPLRQNGDIFGQIGPYELNGQLNSYLSSDDQGDFIETDIVPCLQGVEQDGSRWPLQNDSTEMSHNSLCRENTGENKPNSYDSVKKPSDGPKLFVPCNGPQHATVCDYKKNESSNMPRPSSFGATNRLCTCSVVSYSLGRPVLSSSLSMSSGEVDEGVGGMKTSPVEPSPSDSEVSRPKCGVTVTSDSSSYFSPEDVDLMDFDMDNSTRRAPYNDIDRHGGRLNFPHHSSGSEPRDSRGFTERSYMPRESSLRGDENVKCERCGNYIRNCICQEPNACKRSIEGEHNNQPSPPSSESGCSNDSHTYEEMDHLQELDGNVEQCACYSREFGGNDSGAGSQEHLDEISSEDEERLGRQDIPAARTCDCQVSRYYLGAPVCDQHDLCYQDTNNLDVEVFNNAPSSDYEEELFNVSRQTSTSNFDQDENAFQDAVEDLQSNGFHSACSGSDLESEKNNQASGNKNNGDNLGCISSRVVVPAPSKVPEIPLPIPPRGEESPRPLPPSIPPGVANLEADQEVGEASGGVDNRQGPRPSWSTQSSEDISPMGGLNWSDYDVPSDETDASRSRSRLHPNLGEQMNDLQAMAAYGGGSFDQDFSPTENIAADRMKNSADNLLFDENAQVAMVGRPGFDFLEGSDGAQFPDPIPDIFILNLLRRNESRRQEDSSRSRSSVEKVMIWSEYDAYMSQVKQIGPSACGATAVINVLKALEIQVDRGIVIGAIQTNQRAEGSPLPEYLASRSVAGCTAECLIEGIETITNGEVYGRFFCFYPEREVDLLQWLGDWMRIGAVPVLTLNLQRAVPPGWEIPDAWHHQMAYGIGPNGVYLTNPLELVPEEVILEQLTSESLLLVQRHDVISRWTAETDLGLLLAGDDPQWRQINVLGQVVNILREARRPRIRGFRPQLTTHLRIPAWYRPGVSLFIRRDSEAFNLLQSAEELPIRVPRPAPFPDEERPMELNNFDSDTLRPGVGLIGACSDSIHAPSSDDSPSPGDSGGDYNALCATLEREQTLENHYPNFDSNVDNVLLEPINPVTGRGALGNEMGALQLERPPSLEEMFHPPDRRGNMQEEEDRDSFEEDFNAMSSSNNSLSDTR